MNRKDLETYVLSEQMIKRNVLTDDERYEREMLMDHIRENPSFNTKENNEMRYRISKSLVKRRNAAYKELIDAVLGDDAAVLERYMYHVLENYGSADPRVIDIKMNI